MLQALNRRMVLFLRVLAVLAMMLSACADAGQQPAKAPMTPEIAAEVAALSKRAEAIRSVAASLVPEACRASPNAHVCQEIEGARRNAALNLAFLNAHGDEAGLRADIREHGLVEAEQALVEGLKNLGRPLGSDDCNGDQRAAFELECVDVLHTADVKTRADELVRRANAARDKANAAVRLDGTQDALNASFKDQECTSDAPCSADNLSKAGGLAARAIHESIQVPRHRVPAEQILAQAAHVDAAEKYADAAMNEVQGRRKALADKIAAERPSVEAAETQCASNLTACRASCSGGNQFSCVRMRLVEAARSPSRSTFEKALAAAHAACEVSIEYGCSREKAVKEDAAGLAGDERQLWIPVEEQLDALASLRFGIALAQQNLPQMTPWSQRMTLRALPHMQADLETRSQSSFCPAKAQFVSVYGMTEFSASTQDKCNDRPPHGGKNGVAVELTADCAAIAATLCATLPPHHLTWVPPSTTPIALSSAAASSPTLAPTPLPPSPSPPGPQSPAAGTPSATETFVGKHGETITVENDMGVTVTDASGSLKAQCACGHYHAAAAFMTQVQGLVAQGDWQGLSAVAIFPMRYTPVGLVKDAATFRAKASSIFAPAIRAAIADAEPNAPFCNVQGQVQIGNGVLWAEADASGHVGLTSVFAPVNPSASPRTGHTETTYCPNGQKATYWHASMGSSGCSCGENGLTDQAPEPKRTGCIAYDAQGSACTWRCP